MSVELIEGDCRGVLRELESDSVHAIVTDPPYGLNFMGKAWDYEVPGINVWRECLRVLKPGGHLLSFFGTRTYHRGVVPIEDAGFEIRDQIGWVYGSGFPKSHNQHGDWEGWGTALKPAWEPIVMARKPLTGTVEKNLALHRIGGLNIDDCRVATEENLNGGAYVVGGGRAALAGDNRIGAAAGMFQAGKTTGEDFVQPVGRWPANLIHDGSDEVLAVFPQAGGQLADTSTSSSSRKTQNVYGDMKRGNGREGELSADSDNDGVVGFKMRPGARREDSGSAARFFYCAKASKTDRDDGVRTPPKSFVQFQTANGTSGKASSISEGRNTEYRNTHPTVKPTDLMRYLCRLVTPPGGTVLDPFMGSGSTGRGAVLEGFDFIGIEMDSAYLDIADARIAAAEAKAVLQAAK